MMRAREWLNRARLRGALACFCALVLTCALAVPCALSWGVASAWADEESTEGQAGTEVSDAQSSDEGSSDGQSAGESLSDGQGSGNQVYVNQPSDSSFLYETSIADLAQADAYYDGQTVLVQGEVVGDRVNDEFEDEDCWITLQDAEGHQSVISVNMTKTQSEIIDSYGGYAQTGTTLQVRGTFHLDCPEHQGLSDIHAEEVSAVAAGSATQHAVDERILYAGIAALIAGAALMAVYYVKRERML